MAVASTSLAEYLLAELEAKDGDVTLVLGEGDAQETVLAHGILLRRAEYFRSALKSSYKEGQTSKVVLPDVSPRLMRALVTALYCDNFAHLTLDSGSTLSGDEHFELCRLAERFLVPDVVLHCAYDAWAQRILERSASCQDYVRAFAKLVGTRVPAISTDALHAGFRKLVEAEPWTPDAILPLVAEASARKVDARVQDLLQTTLLKSVTFGRDLTESAVHAAKHGLFDAARDIVEKVSGVQASDVFFESECVKERAALHHESASLREHEQQWLKAMYAIKALPKLEVHKLHFGQHMKFTIGNSNTSEGALLKDIEEATTKLFARAAAAVALAQASSPEKRLACEQSSSPEKRHRAA